MTWFDRYRVVGSTGTPRIRYVSAAHAVNGLVSIRDMHPCVERVGGIIAAWYRIPKCSRQPYAAIH
jgi:hypothetical protein